MKIKNLIAMSLLALMHQFFAADELAKDQQVEQQIIEFLPYSNDQYEYTVSKVAKYMGEGFIAPVTILSDNIVDNYFNNGKTRTLITQKAQDGNLITTTEIWKTKNPSYLTLKNGAYVVGAIAVTTFMYMIYSQIQKDKQALELKLDTKWKKNLLSFKNQPYDSAQTRFELLEGMINKFEVNDRVSRLSGLPSNIKAMYSLTYNISKEEFINFIENLDSYIDKKDKPILHLGDIAYVLDEMRQKDEMSIQNSDYIMQFFEKIGDSTGLNTSRSTAYHEAGHALVGALYERDPVRYGTIMKTENNSGHVLIIPSSASERVFGYSDIDDYKKQIKIGLAGGIGMSKLEGKAKPSCEYFLYEKSHQYGMGDKSRVGSDIDGVYRNAESYLFWSDPISWLSSKPILKEGVYVTIHEDKLFSIIKECYDEVYELIDTHEDELKKIADKLYQDQIVSSDYIYDVTQTKKPEASPSWQRLGF